MIAQRLLALFADPNPILVKELRAIFRTALFIRFLYIATGLVALLVLAIGATVASGDVPPATVGQVVFQLFLGASLLVISLVAPGYASAAITAEHEQRTWESLALSGMSARRVVLGKLAACYASIALVLIAFSPVVGIAFLFGGVSPGQVVVGFLSLLVALAPAVAYGLAISARLRSTRLAIVLSTVTYFPMALFGVSMLGILSDELRYGWGFGMAGPFFYTEAFVTRFFEWDTWALLVGGPLYGLGMPVWFLLASAVVGIRPAAEDRSFPMKVWAIAAAISTVPVAVLVIASQSSRYDTGGFAILAVGLTGLLTIVFGLLFTNEPALPPRAWEVRQASRPRMARVLGLFGPGAAGTMRFAIALSFATLLIVTAAVTITRHLALGWSALLPEQLVHPDSPAEWIERFELACVVLAFGAFVVAAFTASFGAFLRTTLQNGLAARVLLVAALLAAWVLPFVAALLLDFDALGELDDVSPLVVKASIVEPLLLAIQVVEGHVDPAHLLDLAIPVALYGGLALFFYVRVELRVAQAKKLAAAQRARFAASEPG